MSSNPLEWGYEHFCKEDAHTLFYTDPKMFAQRGFPVELEHPPEPATFCSKCLRWFTPPTESSTDEP